MNNYMYTLVLFSFLLFSCGNNQKSKKTKNQPQKNQKESVIKKYKGDLFVADTTINSKLFLENYQSIEKYFGGKSKFKMVEQLRSSPVVVFTNKGKGEYLLAYQYEGNTKNAFSCFEIGVLSELQKKIIFDITQTEIEKFNTENGLLLGQSINEVIKIKGNNFTETTERGEKIISYKIEDTQSGFLKRYNMPSYFLQITFDESVKVKKIIFGFDYP